MSYQDNSVFEFFGDSDRLTAVADVAVTGKTFVVLVPGTDAQAPRVRPAAAGERPYGVAGWSVVAGREVTVYRRGVVSVTAGAALAGGAAVVPGAGGAAVAATVPTDGAMPVAFGLVHADAASGADAAVALSL